MTILDLASFINDLPDGMRMFLMFTLNMVQVFKGEGITVFEDGSMIIP